jgi:hypothetical protein
MKIAAEASATKASSRVYSMRSWPCSSRTKRRIGAKHCSFHAENITAGEELKPDLSYNAGPSIQRDFVIKPPEIDEVPERDFRNLQSNPSIKASKLAKGYFSATTGSTCEAQRVGIDVAKNAIAASRKTHCT